MSIHLTYTKARANLAKLLEIVREGEEDAQLAKFRQYLEQLDKYIP